MEKTRLRTVALGATGVLLTGAMTRERIARLAEDDWRKYDPRFQEPRRSEADVAAIEGRPGR